MTSLWQSGFIIFTALLFYTLSNDMYLYNIICIFSHHVFEKKKTWENWIIRDLKHIRYYCLTISQLCCGENQPHLGTTQRNNPHNIKWNLSVTFEEFHMMLLYSLFLFFIRWGTTSSLNFRCKLLLLCCIYLTGLVVIKTY